MSLEKDKRKYRKGLTKETDESLRKISEALKGRRCSPGTEFKKGHKSFIKGKTLKEVYGEERAKEIIRKKSEKIKGKPCSSKTKFQAGEKHPSWNNGSSFEPYTKEFNDIFKLAIRQRDSFSCLKCNLFEDDAKKLLGRILTVHHIDYNKNNTIKENCCALCSRCNVEVNFNRIHWIKFFQSLLAERYNYKYTKMEKLYQI